MTFTIDRINAIRKALGLSRTTDYPTHKMLDGLDAIARIVTRYSPYGSCPHHNSYMAPGAGLPKREYLGARLARLERHIAKSNNYMFWLGAEGAPA